MWLLRFNSQGKLVQTPNSNVHVSTKSINSLVRNSSENFNNSTSLKEKENKPCIKSSLKNKIPTKSKTTKELMFPTITEQVIESSSNSIKQQLGIKLY